MQITDNELPCHISFKSYLYGEDIDHLTVEISVDGGSDWESLFEVEGNQGPAWTSYSLELDAVTITYFQLRFRVSGSFGSRGDVALDDIRLHGIELVDQNLYTFYADSDDDGFGNPGISIQLCRDEPPAGYSRHALDCNDQDATIHPNAMEIPCNLVDENCNGMEDDGDPQNPMTATLLTLQNEDCPGSMNGSLALMVNGGIPPYAYNWNTGDTASALSNLGKGIYSCTISDATGCLIFGGNYEVKVENELDFILSGETQPTCENNEDGELEILIGGGTPPYSLLWNTGDTTNKIENLASGNYQLTVTDQVGCFLPESDIFTESESRV